MVSGSESPRPQIDRLGNCHGKMSVFVVPVLILSLRYLVLAYSMPRHSGI